MARVGRKIIAPLKTDDLLEVKLADGGQQLLLPKTFPGSGCCRMVQILGDDFCDCIERDAYLAGQAIFDGCTEIVVDWSAEG